MVSRGRTESSLLHGFGHLRLSRGDDRPWTIRDKPCRHFQDPIMILTRWRRCYRSSCNIILASVFYVLTTSHTDSFFRSARLFLFRRPRLAISDLSIHYLVNGHHRKKCFASHQIPWQHTPLVHPSVIISDRNAKFTGSFWTQLLHMYHIKQYMTIAYHPSPDG